VSYIYIYIKQSTSGSIQRSGRFKHKKKSNPSEKMVNFLIRFNNYFIIKMDFSAQKSPNDLKQYANYTLDCGLEVLLVSTSELLISKCQDKDTANAAAAMCVNSGSFCDPSNAEGLAHFLEHMVFMGSAKYPAENQYDSYISSHGGSCNAYTEGEYTCYQFDVLDNHLRTALDMFASCFISPLFNDNAVDRELKAIQSEFDLACTDDDTRLLQLFSSLSEDGHILQKFSWGNRQSLEVIPKEQGIDMNIMLRSFHRTHYTPNNSKLVLVAPRSLEEMASIVNKSFDNWSITNHEENDAIAWLLAQEPEPESEKNNKSNKGKGNSKKGKKATNKKEKKKNNASIVVDTIELPTLAQILDEQRKRFASPLKQQEATILTRVIPIRASHKLVLVWQFPPTQHKYRSKNDEYICHLIGHEGDGSLVSYLKELGLATRVEAGSDGSNIECNSLFSLLQVTIIMTAKGLANWVKVVEAVLHYIAMLCRNGPQERVFRELQRVAQIDYDYLDESSEDDFAERLAVEMSPLLARDRNDLLPGSFLLWDWDPEGIANMLQAMSPDKMIVSLLSAAFSTPNASQNIKEDTNDDGGGNKIEGEGEGEGEDWADISEDESNDEDDDEDEDTKKKKKNDTEEEAAPVSPEELRLLFTGPEEWLNVVIPPAFLPDGPYNLEPDMSNMKKEKHFGTLYWRDPICESILNLWNKAFLATLDKDIPVTLHIPEENPYVPENLIIIQSDQAIPKVAIIDDMAKNSAGQGLNNNERNKVMEPVPVPNRILDESGLRIWHLVDPRFSVPKVGIYLRLASPVASRSPRDSALNDLVRLILFDSLEKELYMADMAELRTSINSTDLGFEIKFRGFNDKAPRLLKNVLDKFIHPEEFVSESSFLLQAEKMIRIYRNDGLKSSSTASSARLVALKPSSYGPKEKSRFLQSPSIQNSTSDKINGSNKRVRATSDLDTTSNIITSACVVKYVQEFLNNVCIEVLGHGNIEQKEFLDVCSEIFRGVKFKLNSNAHISQQILKLPKKIPTVLCQEPRNPDEPSICVELYYQLGTFNVPHSVQLDLLERILYEPFFDQLRSKQQLGYSVSCSARCTFGVVGFLFSVVSSSYTVAEVQRAILAFVAGIPRLITSQKKDDWLDHIDSMIGEVMSPPMNLLETFNDNVGCISDRYYDFDTRVEEVRLIKSFTRESLAGFAQSIFGVATRRLMAVQVSHETNYSPLEDTPKTTKQCKIMKPTDLHKAAEYWESSC
jgi:secreted Zn-dependent insulinase-like peptidase